MMNTNNNPLLPSVCCLIDAYTVTLHGVSPEDIIIHILGQSTRFWEHNDYGRYGYREMYKFGEITLLYNGRPEMGVCLELRGQGCRELQQLTQSDSIFYDILSSTIAEKVNLTRVDIAVDDFAGLLDMETISQKVDRREIRTRIRNCTETKGLADTEGHTVYIGAESSNIRFRIYDKAAQEHAAYHHIRVEMVLRRELAREYQNQVLVSIDKTSPNLNGQMAQLGVGIIKDRLSFIELVDKNISRCPVCRWWEKLLEDAEPLKISAMKKTIQSIEDTDRWIRNQVAASIALMTSLLGPDWLNSVINEGATHIDTEKAMRWVQEMKVVGMTPSLDPRSEILSEELHDLIKNYYMGL